MPVRSAHVPKKKVAKVVAAAEQISIPVIIEGSLPILAYTKVLNQEFSMFQQICPASPSPHTSTHILKPERFFVSLLSFFMRSSPLLDIFIVNFFSEFVKTVTCRINFIYFRFIVEICRRIE